MSSSTPLVTVVVPSFNEEPHIVRASLESIRDQSFTDFECIVVDESTRPELADACRAICAEDNRFRYIHPTERLGLARSLNLAISNARGELIARFDADDLCLPERLALQVEFLAAHPEISVVGGAINVIRKDGQFLAYRRYPQDSEAIAKGMHLTTTIAHPTVMYRKEAIRRHGCYDPYFLFAEDLDLWLRWLNGGIQFSNLPDVLVQYRQDSPRRDYRHWHFNLRARTRNFNWKYPGRRALGIVCIALWMATPKLVQEFAFKALILRNRGQEALGR